MSGPGPRLPTRLPAWPPDAFAAPGPSRGGAALYLLALALVACWDLAGRSIFHRDLPRFAVIAREMIQGGDWLVPRQHGELYANKPILYIWLVAAPSALVGDPTVLLLRLPSALALVGTALATSAWGRARSGSAAVGRVAGLLVATTMLTNELGRTGRPDMLATCWSTVGAMLLDRAALGRGGRHDPMLAGLALGAGLLSKGPVALLVAAAVLLVPTPGTTLRERMRRGRPLVVLGLALAVAALWMVPAWLRAGDTFLRRLAVDQVKDRVSGQGGHNESAVYYLRDLPAVLLPWAPLTIAAVLASAWPRPRARLGGAALALVVAATLAVLSAVPTKEVRYAAIVVPPMSILAATGAAAVVAGVGDPRRAARHLLGLGVAAALVGLGCLAVVGIWPSAAVAVVPPALVAAASGACAIARARRADEPAPAVAGRVAGLALVLASCAVAAFWGTFARYLTVWAVRENAAVAAVLPAGAPVAVVGAPDLEPDDLYVAVTRPIPVPAPERVPTPARAPRLVVVCLRDDVAAVAAARGQTPVELLARPREGHGGGTLVVLDFGR